MTHLLFLIVSLGIVLLGHFSNVVTLTAIIVASISTLFLFRSILFHKKYREMAKRAYVVEREKLISYEGKFVILSKRFFEYLPKHKIIVFITADGVRHRGYCKDLNLLEKAQKHEGLITFYGIESIIIDMKFE